MIEAAFLGGEAVLKLAKGGCFAHADYLPQAVTCRKGIIASEDRKKLSEIGYQVIDAKNEHVEKGWIVRVPNDDERVLIAASEGEAWDAARDHHASMTSEVTQADRKAIDRAEAFAKSKHTTPDEHDDIMVAVRLARLNARQSGEGERLREAAAGVLAHRVDGPTRGWLRDNRDSRAALDALAAALRATDDAGGA